MAEENGDLSAVLGKLLEDPEMLGRALKTAETLKSTGVLDGLLSSGAQNGKQPADSPAPAGKGAYAHPENAYIEEKSGKDLLPAPGNAASGEAARASKQRKELLAAVRPFMSRERQERIDGILQILRLLELMQQFGVNGIFR